MKNAVVVVLSLAASFVVRSVMAFDWTGVDGVVTVPVDTEAEITAADISAVEALKEVVLSDGSSVIYGTTDTLVLTARVSGTGAFIGNGKGKLVLLGDNSGLVAPGHFEFINTMGVVSNEFGLGSSATGPCYVHIDNSGTAANRTNYSLKFGSPTGVATNHVAVQTDTSIDFGSESASERLVMDAGFKWLGSGACQYLYLKGNTEFVSGQFYVNHHFYTGTADGHTERPTLCFYGESDVYIRLYIFGSETDFHFNSTGTVSIGRFCAGNFFLEREQAVANTCAFTPQVVPSHVDLGGFDQVFDSVNFSQYGSSYISAGSTTYSEISSAAAAQFGLRKKLTSEFVWGFKFTGFAGYNKNFADDIQFVNHVSDSKGTLAVSAGSLEFANDAGWADGLVQVTGGKLICTSANSLNTGKPVLEVTGGSLVVPDGRELAVASARIGGTDLPIGTYKVANLHVTYGDLVVAPEGEEGTGGITVCGTSEWTGWPDEPGQDVLIPVGVEVVVSDADVAKVAQVASIAMSPSSSLVFSNETQKLDLTAKLLTSGASKLSFVCGANVILDGDNSGYAGTTSIDATSTVIVSNRYGLGASETPAVTVAASGVLLFGGNGLTNDVPLMTEGSRQFQVDPENDGTFVQNGTLNVGSGPTVTFGDAELNGIYKNISGSMSTSVLDGHRVTMNGSASCVGYFKLEGSGTFLFNSTGNSWGRIYNYSAYVHMVCGETDVLKIDAGTETGFVHIDAWDPIRGSLDLNGYDQTIPYIYFNTAPAAGKTTAYQVKSDTPATLTFNEAKANDYIGAIKFSGQVGFRYASAGKYTLRNIVSDSIGKLTVEKGTLEISDKAGWSGDIEVTGGKLILSSIYSAGNNTTITVSGDGELNIPEGCVVFAKKLVAGGRTIDTKGRYPVSDLQIPGVTGGGQFWVGNELYVSPTGNDANDGFTRETPKKTLQTVLTNMCVEGTTVYLLPGRYDTGSIRTKDNKGAEQKTLARLYVPKSVNLAGLGKASEVFIVGESAPEEKQVPGAYGCGEDAVRCLYLVGDSTIRNITLTGGRSWCTGTSTGSSSEGYSAIYCLGTGNSLIDCVVSNNVADIGPMLSNMTLIRCRITKNRATWYASGTGSCSHYNCVVDGNFGGYPLHHPSHVVNCTLGPGNSADDLRTTSPGDVHNTIISKYVAALRNDFFFYRTFFALREPKETEAYADCLRDGCAWAPDITVTLDGDFRPEKGQCDVIDAGNDDYLSLLPAKHADEAMAYDFYGRPRRMGAAVDVGAVEYDWFLEFSKIIGRGVEVTAASTGVVESDAGKVTMAGGSRLAFTLTTKHAEAPRIVRFSITGAGALKAYLNGALAGTFAEGDTMWTIPGGSTSDEIVLEFEGEGSVELGRTTVGIGMLLIVR